MKKYLVLFGAVIVMMALAAPAVAQFTSWGHMDIQTIWEKKPDFNTGMPWQFDSSTGATKRDEAWRHIAQRFRFYLQYGDPKTVRAVIGFEADSQDWGEAGGGGTTGNQSNSTVNNFGPYNNQSNHMGVYRTDEVQLEIKHAYIDFVVPNTPLTFTAGLQFFDVGGRIWMNNDAPGMKLAANFAPHRITGFWWRENDGTGTSTTAVANATGGTSTTNNSDRNFYHVNDTYGLMWEMAQQQFNIMAFGAYKNDLFTGTSANPLKTVTATTPEYDDHPWTVGVQGGFRPGNWNFSGTAIYVGGKREFKNYTGAGGNKSDYSGYGGEIAAKYQIGPGLFAGLEGYYASGQNTDKGDKLTGYLVPTSSEGQSNFGNDRTIFMWMNAAQMGYYHERNFAISGFWYGRGNVEFSPTSYVRFNLNYLYIGDTNKGTPGSYSVTSVNPFSKAQTGAKGVNSPIGSRQNENLDYVGSEINLITTFNIYKNFVYNVGIYYFLPGKMFDRVDSTGNVVQKAEDSYGLNSMLKYAF